VNAHRLRCYLHPLSILGLVLASILLSMAVGGLAEGDVTLDGAVNVLDVIFAVHKILGLVQFNPLQFSVGDLNDDGVINVLDILQIVNIILAPSQ